MAEDRTPFDQIGGELALRAIIDDFVERVFSDTMIGFFFARVSKSRIKQLEYEHAAQWLGASVLYSGRSIREAHAKHPIMGGQFARRRKLLESTLIEHGVDAALCARWLAHTDSLLADVTGDAVTECNDARAAARLATSTDGADGEDA